MDMLTRETGYDEPEEEEDLEKEADLPPEYCHYRDEGCEFAAACLDCPFPQCLYDEPRGRQRWLKGQRNREIARMYGTGRWGMKELASLFGLSPRTIQRALKGRPTQAGEPRDGIPVEIRSEESYE